jgi:uncharacterized protein DUF3987
LKAIREREDFLNTLYESSVQSFQNELEAWQKQRAQILADKKNHPSVSAKRLALENLGEAPEPPLLPMLTCPEPTYEGLTRLLRFGQPSVGIFSSEGGQFIGGHAMSDDNRLKTGAALSSLWDGAPIKRVRQGDGSYMLRGRRVCMHLLVQPGVALRLLSDAVLEDQGMLSRLLTVLPDSEAGRRFWRDPSVDDFSKISSFSSRISEILATPMPLRQKENELNPRVLTLSSDARRLWTEFADHIEGELGENGQLHQVKGFGNKAPEHAARLAAVLGLVENISSETLSGAHMAAGIELAQYYLGEALRIQAAGFDKPELVLAEKLLSWLLKDWRSKEQTGYVSLPDIYQLGPAAIRSKEVAARTIAILEDHGYARRQDRPAIVNGVQRKEVWKLLEE